MVKHIAKIVLGDEMYYVKDTEARNALIDLSEKGVAGGVATLDNSGKVPSSQLPESYASVSKLTVGETEYNPIDGNITIPAYPTTLPASDVSAWAKSDTKPSYTKSEIGLDNVTNDAQVKRSEMGVAEGVATLDTAGKIPSSQLPSYVDDVLEYADKSSFPATGETGKIYVDTSTNLSWRWGGTTYVEISPSLALGETSSTAYAGDKGKALADKLAGIESGAQAHKAPTTAEVKSALGTGSGTSKYLREDGTWQTPPDNNTTYSAGSGLSLSGTTFSLALTKALVTSALGYTPPTTDTNTWRTVQCNGTSIGNNTLNLKAGTNVSLSNSNGTITIASTDTNTWRGILNNLSSTSSTESLSANMGRMLANGSARDDTKVSKSGDTMTGKLKIDNRIDGGSHSNGGTFHIDAYNNNALFGGDTLPGAGSSVAYNSSAYIALKGSTGTGGFGLYAQNSSERYGNWSFINGLNATNSSGNSKISLYCNSEGGNLMIESPNGKYWEMDDYNDTALRFISFNSSGGVQTISELTGSTGRFKCAGYDTTSDMRKKEVLENYDILLNDIINAPLFKYKWISPEADKDTHIGTSAQYWKTITPEIVSESNDNEHSLSLQYDIAALISVISLSKIVKEQLEKIVKLEEDIELLKAKIN